MKPLLIQIAFLILSTLGFFACNLKEIEDYSTPGGGGKEKFVTSLGGSFRDVSNNVINSSDGGFVIVGNSEEGQNRQAYIAKIDAQGTIKWQKNFGGAKVEVASGVTQTVDGGFILCGYSTSFSPTQAIFLVKVNSLGDKVWEKPYPVADSSETAIGIVPVGSSGDLLVGYNNYDIRSVTAQFKFLRIKSNGDKIFNKLGSNGQIVISSMIKTSDGKIVVAGLSYGSNTDLYVAKFNDDASLISENRFPIPTDNYFYPRDLVELPDKSIVVAGSGNTGNNNIDFNLLAFSQVGTNKFTQLWNKPWGGADNDQLQRVSLSKDNQLVVLGYTSNSSLKTQLYLSKRKASNGELIWEKYFPEFSFPPSCLATASDGGFLLTGYTDDQNGDIIVVKTNKDGEYK